MEKLSRRKLEDYIVDMEAYVDLVRKQRDDALALIEGYEQLLCVKFCGVLARFKQWLKGLFIRS